MRRMMMNQKTNSKMMGPNDQNMSPKSLLFSYLICVLNPVSSFHLLTSWLKVAASGMFTYSLGVRPSFWVSFVPNTFCAVVSERKASR